MSSKFCTQGPALRVEVIEDMMFKGTTSYKFNATITRVCEGKKEPTYVEYVEDGK